MSFPGLIRGGYRGIKICPQCGYFNGQRSKVCKSQRCDMVFTNGAVKRKPGVDICQLTTGSLTSIYSVKRRDKGPDYRGFVELNALHDDPEATEGGSVINFGKCFIESCVPIPKSVNGTQLTYFEADPCNCLHIRSAVDCSRTADVLVLKKSVINRLNIRNDMKQDILKMRMDSAVQRVSKQVMVVKTNPTKKHPLGYLHVSFLNIKTMGQKHFCGCNFSHAKSLKKRSTSLKSKESLQSSSDISLECSQNQKEELGSDAECIHFYLCATAFASNESLCEEFRFFVDMALPNYQFDPTDNMDNENDDHNLIAGEILTNHELTDGVLSPFVSQLIELPDGNGHMIELHAELHTDGQLYKNTKSTTISDDLGDSGNTIYNDRESNADTIDLQIMLTDGGDLINVSNIVLGSNEDDAMQSSIILKNQLLQNNSMDCTEIGGQSNMWELKDDGNTEIINVQEVLLREADNIDDNIYTISANDNSLKIISLEEYDPITDKRDDLYNDVNANYQFLNAGIDGVQNTMTVSDILNNGNIIELNSDDELFSCLKRKRKKVATENHSNSCVSISNDNVVILNSSDRSSQGKTLSRKRKKTIGKTSANQSNSFLNCEFVNDNEIASVINNYDSEVLINGLHNETNMDSSLSLSNGVLTRIINLNTNEVKNCSQSYGFDLSGSNYSSHKSSKNSHSIKDKKLCKIIPMQPDIYTESEASLSFIQWLSCVTENINQTMQYQFSGKPDPLVFHIPQVFFECLQERLCYNTKKKRLPNKTSVFERKDAVPLGRFTKHTWNITNIFQVKNIFDTPDIPLEITKFFQHNSDGTYTHIDRPVPKSKLNDPNGNLLNNAKTVTKKKTAETNLKPGHLVTFLKVGNTEPDQKVPTPFCIEWIPNISPKCKFGELRLKYEYGHKQNYVV